MRRRSATVKSCLPKGVVRNTPCGALECADELAVGARPLRGSAGGSKAWGDAGRHCEPLVCRCQVLQHMGRWSHELWRLGPVSTPLARSGPADRSRPGVRPSSPSDPHEPRRGRARELIDGRGQAVDTWTPRQIEQRRNVVPKAVAGRGPGGAPRGTDASR